MLLKQVAPYPAFAALAAVFETDAYPLAALADLLDTLAGREPADARARGGRTSPHVDCLRSAFDHREIRGRWRRGGDNRWDSRCGRFRRRAALRRSGCSRVCGRPCEVQPREP